MQVVVTAVKRAAARGSLAHGRVRRIARLRSAPQVSPGVLRALLCAACVAPCLYAAEAQQPSAAPLPETPQPQGTATLLGAVQDTGGAIISGAKVVVSTPDRPTRQAITDGSGDFSLPGLAPGPFTATVSLPGFTMAHLAGTLTPGQQLQLPNIVLALATVQISVDAISPEQAALEQLHTEEHQRLVGVLPNFFVSYNWTAPPLTAKQKFTLSTHNAVDPGNLALVGLVAGVQQATDSFPGYHQGLQGYGKRFGADLGNLVVGTYMGGAVLPSLFHQDPRYFWKGTGTRKARFLYAISRAVITRGDNGHNQPNFSGVLGDLSAGAISNIYYPASDRQGALLTIENGLLGVAGDAMNGFFQEFFLSKATSHSPDKITP